MYFYITFTTDTDIKKVAVQTNIDIMNINSHSAAQAPHFGSQVEKY